METLIINKRHELPKRKRYLWDALTIALWLWFIYLWKPVIHVFHRIATSNVPGDEISDWVFENVHSVTVVHALYMLVLTPIILLILSRLNRHRAPSEHLLYESSDYSGYFRIDNDELERCSESQYVTVYHDEHGHITRLDNQITQ